MGRKKTNRKKSIAHKREMTCRERAKVQTMEKIKQCYVEFVKLLEDERKKQESYKWN